MEYRMKMDLKITIKLIVLSVAFVSASVHADDSLADKNTSNLSVMNVNGNSHAVLSEANSNERTVEALVRYEEQQAELTAENEAVKAIHDAEQTALSAAHSEADVMSMPHESVKAFAPTDESTVIKTALPL